MIGEWKMGDVKTIVGHLHESLGPGANIEETDEIIAEEDMYIIGALFGCGTCGGAHVNQSVQRSGQHRRWADYHAGAMQSTEDGVMFGNIMIVIADNEYNDFRSNAMFLPRGSYFLVEKGERFYIHHWMQNEHATSTFELTSQVLIYYQTKKPT